MEHRDSLRLMRCACSCSGASGDLWTGDNPWDRMCFATTGLEWNPTSQAKVGRSCCLAARRACWITRRTASWAGAMTTPINSPRGQHGLRTALFTRRSRLPRAPPLSRPKAWRCSKVERRAGVCRWRVRLGVSAAPPQRLCSVHTARAFAQAFPPPTGQRRLTKSRSQARLTPAGVPDNGHWGARRPTV